MPAVVTLHKDFSENNIDPDGDQRLRPEGIMSGYPKTVTQADRFTFGINGIAEQMAPGQYSLVIEGYLEWMAASAYDIRIRSIDGVRLWINGVLVIDNWGEAIPAGGPLMGDWNDVGGGVNNDHTTGVKVANSREAFRLEWYGHLDNATTDENWLALGIKVVADASYTYWEDNGDVAVRTS